MIVPPRPDILELGSGISSSTDIMVIQPWYGRQSLVYGNVLHRVNMRLTLR